MPSQGNPDEEDDVSPSNLQQCSSPASSNECESGNDGRPVGANEAGDSRSRTNSGARQHEQQLPPAATEPLACVSCRARKLKCDKAPGTCGRCAKVGQECVYPESRRRPTFKKRNVRELEARLAQVEDLLKEAAKSRTGGATGGRNSDEKSTDSRHGINLEYDDVEGTHSDPIHNVNGKPEAGCQGSGLSQPFGDGNGPALGCEAPQPMPFDLISMGMFESLPPQQVMEDLHKSYFQHQHNHMPIIHPGSYLRSFYSAQHLKPPMCLQYAIWAIASNGHERYHTYHDVFYQRARRYAEADELKGHGEYFITLQHAQAWALISTDEAGSMFFTRAAMSAAKCTKLVQVLGLHRLDGPESAEIPLTLAPPRSWVELEERRRTFWGAFCIDSHGVIATGWPAQHDWTEIATHLPASEEAFNRGRERGSCRLTDAFTGRADYGAFAGTVILCHMFNRILRHVHHMRGADGEMPEDVAYGAYWKRHRELDNLLSSAFMNMPDTLRLPRNLMNPAAAQTNLNLHAGIICLHHAALDRIDTYKLPGDLRRMSLMRMHTAAAEVVNIMRLTSHQNPGYKSPLVALTLYCAASFHIFQAKETYFPCLKASSTAPPTTATASSRSSPASSSSPNQDSLASQPSSTTTTTAPTTAQPTPASISPPQYDFSNLEFLLSAMEAIGREHTVTRAFLRQALDDIEHNNLLGAACAAGMRFPRGPGACNLQFFNMRIPLLARSSVTRNTSTYYSPLPGRLPLNAPLGEKPPEHRSCSTAAGVGRHGSGSGSMGGNCFMGHISKTEDPATVVPPAPASSSSPPAEDNGGETEMTATTATRKRRRTDGPSSSSPPSSGCGGGNPTTNSIIQDALFVEPPPQGVSRVEHLLGNMGASASPIMPRPAPPHVANPGFMTATATTGEGRAASRLLSRSGGVDASWRFGNHNSNDGIVVDQRGDQQHAISRDLPTHLPFRRALHPVFAAPQPAWGPAGGVNGFAGAQQPQQQPQQQQPSLDVNPFGIMEQDVVDVDALLTSMGHGTVIGMVDGNEGSGSIYPGSTAGMSMDDMLGNDFPMAMDNAGTTSGAGTSSGRVRVVEEQQQRQQQEQQQSTTRSESHPWAVLNLPATNNDGQLAGMRFGNVHG